MSEPRESQVGEPVGGATESAGPAGSETFEARETGRLEAFSDGVFAIAATLLVLNLHVPSLIEARTNGELWHALVSEWPTYVAFVISFLSILIMWSSHHNIFSHIGRVDHNFLLLNGLLLLGVTVTPFTTSLLAQHLDSPSGRLSAMIYSAVALAISLAYNAMWHYAARGRRLLAATTSEAEVRAVTRQYAVGPAAFAVAFILSAVSPLAGVTVFVVVEVFFALPVGPNRRVTAGAVSRTP